VQINARRVQGSGIGQTAYISASDLHPLDQTNWMAKFADDSCLLVGSSKRHTITVELAHDAAWANLSNLRFNSSKTWEMIVTKRGKARLPHPD